VVLLYGLVAVLKLAGADWTIDLPGLHAFWVVRTFAFILMFLDSSFGVHERYTPVLGVNEVVFLLVHGMLFGLSVLANIRKVGTTFLGFFVKRTPSLFI
jgi:hypothetical protein